MVRLIFRTDAGVHLPEKRSQYDNILAGKDSGSLIHISQYDNGMFRVKALAFSQRSPVKLSVRPRLLLCRGCIFL